MHDKTNITIAMLIVSAAILGGMMLAGTLTAPATAATPIRGGDYIMVTGSYLGAIDILYVLDIAAGKMNAYVTHPVEPFSLTLKDQINLKQAFVQAGAAAGGAGATGVVKGP